jgi:peroxiredoxin-like protein
MESHLYHVNLNWEKERIGNIYSPELNDKIVVATPPEFPKGVEGIWSPEHLFTAAVNSCFMTTFLAIAENSKLEFTSFSCASSGKLEQVEGKFLMTEIILNPELVITNSIDAEKAEKILQKAEKACLISNSIKSTIVLQTNVKVLETQV